MIFALFIHKLVRSEENMSFEISKVHSLLVEGMNGRALRQELIASNIANIDTPNYKARDIDFESALIQKSKDIFEENGSKKLKMAKTSSSHLSGYSDIGDEKATIYLRDGQMQRNDGNTVDLDVETTELSKNAIMYDALTAALKKDGMIFKSVLDASAKV
jgi:flagellar basal-body rod protein FlgB